MSCWGGHCWAIISTWSDGKVEYACRHCQKTNIRYPVDFNKTVNVYGGITTVHEGDDPNLAIQKMLKRLEQLELKISEMQKEAK